MKNVCRILLVSVIFSACTKTTNQSLLSLGASLTPMISSSPSPFSQNFSSNNFLIFQGSCLSIVQKLQISFDSGAWSDIPSMAPTGINGNYNIGGSPVAYTETVAPPFTYDADCSNGDFNIYIYRHQLDEYAYNIYGVLSAGINPNTISIRGVASGGFTTAPTTFTNPSPGSGGGSGNPTKMTIAKTNSQAGTLYNSCTQITVSLRGSDGIQTNYPSAISFSIAHLLNGSNDATLVYPTYSDCSTSNSGVAFSLSSLSFPANANQFSFYYRAVTFGDVNSFTLNNSGSTPTLITGAPLVFTNRSASNKFLDFQTPYKVLTGYCYPGTLSINNYTGTGAYDPSNPISVGGSSEITLFSDSACTTALSPSVTMGSPSTKAFYFKVTASGSNGVATLNATASGYDAGSREVAYDTSGDTNVTYARINGPNTISYTNADAGYTLERYNTHGTSIILATGTTVGVSVGSGYFCGTASCGTAISSITIPGGSSAVTLYYEPAYGVIGTFVMSSSGAGLITTNQNVVVTP